MATKLLQPSMKDSQVSPLICRTMNIMKLQRMVPAGNRSRINTSRFCERPLWFRPITIIKVAEHSTSSGLVEDETLAQKKRELYQAVEGINKGIFGIPSVKKSEIESLIKQLESQNPTPDPTLELEKMAGCWRLVYSTISILGSKRTKLGLRDFISLDEFFQNIDISKSKAINVIKFSARGLTLLSGQLSIEASFKIASTTRVGISFENSTITPDQLMNLFRKNYDLLLGIFNPEGWLEITYVDDSMRIGRDDKGNIFVLERFEDSNSLYLRSISSHTADASFLCCAAMPKPKSTLKTHGKFCSRKQKEILLSEGYFCSQEKRNEQMKGGLAVKRKVVEFSVAMRSRSHDDASSTHVVSGKQVDGGLWQSGSVFWGWDAVVASSLCMSC